MNRNDDSSDLNEAILTGILGFSVVFFSMKDIFSQANQTHFIVLIFIYIIAAIWRIFGIVLGLDKITTSCIHYCRIVLIPATVWVAITVLFTELNSFLIGSILSFYAVVLVEYLIVTKIYGLKYKIRNPIVLSVDKEKKN